MKRRTLLLAGIEEIGAPGERLEATILFREVGALNAGLECIRADRNPEAP
jgi:hypothetical protein